MHESPAVIYPVGPAPALGAMLAGLWLGGAGAWLAWYQMAGWVLDWRLASGIAMVGVAGGMALRGWRVLARGELGWNGHEWVVRLEAGTELLAGLGLHLDLQSQMLLRLYPTAGGQARWAWAARRTAPSRWNDLRRAVYAHPAAHPAPVAALAP